MSDLLVVFGATGNQGGSVINSVLNDAELSKLFSIRGVTRDITKPEALALKAKGVDVVQADLNDPASISNAVKDARAVFAVTATVYDEKLAEREYAQGKAIADAAVKAGVHFLVYSTLPSPALITGGKYTPTDHFDVKHQVEQYIRVLPIKSAFFAPGSFMPMFPELTRPTGDGTFAIYNVMSANTTFPLIDVANDTGKWVSAILAEPEKHEGQVVAGTTKLYTIEEIVEILSKASGKTVKYVQVPADTFRNFMPPIMAERIMQMMLYFQDVGYYGPQTKQVVEASPQKARGKPNTFEEYLANNPVTF